MNKIIEKIAAREILDSRGNPTLEACVTLKDGSVGKASVPSGASTGKFEAHERRDGDAARYGGRGVLAAVHAVNHVIAPVLEGHPADEQQELDDTLLTLDGSETKEKLGANATLAVSLAAAHAAAAHYHLPLYRYLGGIAANALPTPMMNILNGGAHAANNVDIQEFMIVPHGAPNFAEALRWGSEIYHALGKLLHGAGLATTVGDEGGFAPDLDSDEEALELIVNAVKDAGYDTAHVGIALDIAASEWASGDAYHLPKRGERYTGEEWIAHLATLLERYPILSLEDALGEEDGAGWRALTEHLGGQVMLVGDDLFVTNPARLAWGIREKLGNAVLVKPNQIGTLSETLTVIERAKRAGYTPILSHRSGETEDTTIADLAVAFGAPFIKSGAPCRTDRVAKYNRLLAIEEELGKKEEKRGAVFAFRASLAHERV